MPPAIIEEGVFTGFRRSNVGFTPRSICDIVFQKGDDDASITNFTDAQKVATFDLLLRYFADPSLYRTKDITKALHPAFVKNGDHRKLAKALADALLEGLVRTPVFLILT